MNSMHHPDRIHVGKNIIVGQGAVGAIQIGSMWARIQL